MQQKKTLNCINVCENKVCENKVFEKNFVCYVIMPSKDTKILDFDQYQKLDKGPFIMYANLQCII